MSVCVHMYLIGRYCIFFEIIYFYLRIQPVLNLYVNYYSLIVIRALERDSHAAQTTLG